MKVNDPADTGPPRVLGKEFLIVIVAICSALSFSLGYFVGMRYRDKGSATASPVLAPESPQPPAMAQAERPDGSSAPALPQADRQQEQAQTLERRPADAGDKATGSEAAAPQKAPAQKNVPLRKDGPAVSGTDKAVAPEAGAAYTVQLGALKNAGEARRLKERLSRKGLKITIMVAKNQKNEKIYKIRAGEFAERKEAEALAAKLKKNEGLKAFVTPKQE